MTAKKYDVTEISAVMRRGENIMEWIRSRDRDEANSLTAIAYSYDAQAGSYTAALKLPEVAALKAKTGERLASLLDPIAPFSLLEAGVGEATSLAAILKAMRVRPRHTLGFDISLSRLLFARRHLRQQGFESVELFSGSLDRVPLADRCVDTVLTIHAIEPNFGIEEEILSELLRVARRYLILVEPSYELGSAQTKARIERLGYVRDLPGILQRLGHKPVRFERWGLDGNPENEAALIVVDKLEQRAEIEPSFISPISNRPVVRRTDCWFCPEDGHAFPIIEGIPCLNLDNAVLASKLAQY